MADFEMAKDKVFMGTERRSMVISDEEKRNDRRPRGRPRARRRCSSTHHDPVHKVTIIPRGPALGVTQYLPKEDRLSLLEGAGRGAASQSPSAAASPRRSSSARSRPAPATTSSRRPRSPADGERVGHEREARPARLRQEGGARSSSAATTASARRTTRSRPRRRSTRRSARSSSEQYDARAGPPHARSGSSSRASPKALIERETLDAEEIEASSRAVAPESAKLIIPTYAEKDKAEEEAPGSREHLRRPAEARAGLTRQSRVSLSSTA